MQKTNLIQPNKKHDDESGSDSDSEPKKFIGGISNYLRMVLSGDVK